MPARQRTVLDELQKNLPEAQRAQIVITAEPGAAFLLVFPIAKWMDIEAQLDQTDALDAQQRAFRRHFQGMAQDVELDAQGRFLIPPLLRKQAGLDKEVLLIGQGQKMELWDAARWEAWTASQTAMPTTEGFALRY